MENTLDSSVAMVGGTCLFIRKAYLKTLDHAVRLPRKLIQLLHICRKVLKLVYCLFGSLCIVSFFDRMLCKSAVNGCFVGCRVNFKKYVYHHEKKMKKNLVIC